jgi:hypothetical protein
LPRGQDSLADPWLETSQRDEIDVAAEESGELSLETGKGEQPHLRAHLEFDENVDVALGVARSTEPKSQRLVT